MLFPLSAWTSTNGEAVIAEDYHYETEMALFHQGIQKCAREPLDTADIVREVIFWQLSQTAQGDNIRAQIWHRLGASSPSSSSQRFLLFSFSWSGNRPGACCWC